ncbi:phosphoribosylamine--glycine ligase PurD [Thermoclostridium stercorarium subsp. stercorarium DSM 8532]|jgi:phosphoribosylamine--glycine ligase|uniref:Phosphoribosylamine--glycine ligase n=2 Tax=Thermoclostridium stercorarium TaxID=1510 RepID=L7VQL0_THES1|nr:phosphoribosylamine--glycine ligase [Thermoclostridium stercorarium]AGC69092.1 phosphoribosylamine--glycine ligase PurD [Thermoclostridium stercorarium subsp. stercorarium DSM 8532]AGI40064.1 phosphoribosylamine-glycine ligase [Thermoclostridium stercorarium subsp. stercorarium DSM 8532]ANX02011.1 phosphoribosylamine--glycine ligase [Thermoclostridium stercorarium subsp. leptospartum DSM 9219]
MKVLVIGSGGREHAIVWKISQSRRVEKVFCAPGNGGISEYADCLDIGVLDTEAIVKACKEKNIDLVVVAPDDPLAIGMVNELAKAGIRAFGPTREAALIESSKSFAKNLMKKYGIPTAEFEAFSDMDKALEYIKHRKYPIVVKADGLALGKGVIICNTEEEAREAVISMMEGKKFGNAGKTVVIEEFLTGREVSVLSFTDGKTIIPMVSAQDHKRVFDGDKGPNTGGMGAFSPSPFYTEEIAEVCMNRIFRPTIEAMNREGRTFKGVLYFGLIITEQGPKVLEYNARFGDPETQVVLPRLKNDLLDVIDAVIDERLDQINIEWDDLASLCVIMASEGYPKEYRKGLKITGLESVRNDKDIIIFHAGTKKVGSEYYTSGGRVLGITALGRDLKEARNKAYNAVSQIHFDGAHYRRDIGDI